MYDQSQNELDIETVKCAGIDELVYEMNIEAPDFIKFDLESAEEFALHNGDKIFREKRPLILLELHGEKAKEAAGLFSKNISMAVCLCQICQEQMNEYVL